MEENFRRRGAAQPVEDDSQRLEEERAVRK